MHAASSVGLEILHSEAIAAGQGLSNHDVGHHELFQRVDDGIVQAFGNGYGPEVLIQEIALRLFAREDLGADIYVVGPGLMLILGLNGRLDRLAGGVK